MVTAVMRTCRGALFYQGARKQSAKHSLHQRLCPNTGLFPWRRAAKVLKSSDSIPCAHQTLGCGKRSFGSIVVPSLGRKEKCDDFPRQHHNTAIIGLFPCEQLAKWVRWDEIHYTQLKILTGAMPSPDSGEVLRKYLEKAISGYQTFDFQTISRYSSNEKPFIIKYASPSDILLGLFTNSDFLGRNSQAFICEKIPLGLVEINSVMNIIARFNCKYPFAIGLNK
jgi:hypothetical protein